MKRAIGTQTGLEVAQVERWRSLKGLAVGLICNPTAVDQNLRHAVDLMAKQRGFKLKALFGPEHGVRGDVQYMEAVADGRDSKTGLPVISLYGRTQDSLAPTAAQLRGLDALVFDIQDVGSRFYTFQATMMLCLEAAARQKLKFVVLDRPNPIGGELVEGPALQPGFESFCGLHDLAPRHGMTVGELCLLFKKERKLDVEVEVIQCRGYRRSARWEETRQPWVIPSPNMPTIRTALVYPGMCLFEGTNLSEGRGTTLPFELWGAPWLDADALVDELEGLNLPGVHFRPTHFTPTWDKHAGHRCHGAAIHVVDTQTFKPFRTGLACIATARKQSPDKFAWRTEPYEFVSDRLAIDLLCGSQRERESIEAEIPLSQLVRRYGAEERAFARRRQPFLLYS